MPFGNPLKPSDSDASFRDTEALYHSIYAAMDEGMALHEIIYDNEGGATDYRIIDINPAFEHITGITRDKAVNTLASELYGTGKPPFLDIYARVAQSCVTESFETYFSPMSRSFSIKVLSSEKGRFATIFEDITERIKSRLELQKTARQRQLALDAADMGWWSYDPVTRFSTWDDRYKAIFGVAENQLPNDEILNRIIHPEDLPGLWACVEAALDPADPQLFHTRYRINRPDGATRWIEAHGIATFEGDGDMRRATSLVGTVVDITVHKQSEEALVQSLERLKLAQVSAGVGVWDWNLVTGKLEWSEELFRLFGLDPASAEATFEVWKNVMHPDDRFTAGKRIETSVRNRTQLVNEYRIVHPSGETRWINAIGNTTYDGSGNPLRMAGICIDITQRKRFEELLQKEHRETLLANLILQLFMEETGDDLFGKVLAVLLEQTGSRHGIFGYITEQGHLACPSLSLMFDTCAVPGKKICFPPDAWKGFWGLALQEKRQRLSNDASVVPRGHVAIFNNLATPVIFQGQVVGLIHLANKSEGFSDDDAGLVAGVAERIAPVLYAWTQRNLRDEERDRAQVTQQRIVKRFELLAQTAWDLLHAHDPQEIVESLCRRVMEFLDCQAFFNYLVDEKLGRLHLNSYSGIPDIEARCIEWLDYGIAVCGCVARDGCRIVAEHVQSVNDPQTARVKSYGIEAYACHPLLGPGDKVIGTLSFGTHSRETFSIDDLDLMKAVADQIAAAMIRMQSEQELQESREDLCRAQAVARIGSWRLDVTRNELTWSDENHRIFGFPKGTPMTYETFLSVVHPEDRDFVDGQWKSALAGNHYDIEHRLLVDGAVKWVRETAGLEFDASGNLLGGFGTTQDITGRKRDEEELRKYRDELEKLVDERTSELRRSQELLLHAQKMEAMGQLAGGIAHDFNNMMQVVIGYAHRALRKLDFENPLRENLERINQAAKSASILTHRLLAFSSRQMLQPQVLSPNELVNKIMPILQHTLGEDINFSCTLQPGIGNVKVDPTHLEQVIMNMMVNARNAMPSGGRLSIQTADTNLGEVHPYDKDPVAPGPYVMLAISDTGCGMDKKTMEKIFEPFFTTRPFGSGSGLGLATAYGTIRQSAGAIRVYSEIGKGTTFKIYLPRCDDPPSECAPLQEEVATGSGSKTVLVVEDNIMAREFVVIELRDLGYQVLSARNVEDAYSISRSHGGPIHLLLTDVVLPGISGREISGVLSAQRPEMATLYMSGYDKDLVIKQGKLAMEARLLVKPFSPERLASGVREAMLDGIVRKTGTSVNGTPVDHYAENPEPMRILVVDDDPGIACIISEILREPGDAVEAAEDGATALKIAATLKPEVVLLDIKLPDMDGYELARRIREMCEGVGPYIIAASGYSPEFDADNSMFDDYIIKPIDFTRLKELVANRANRTT